MDSEVNIPVFRIECPALGSLKFESDILAEEKASQFSNEKPNEIVKEGFVTVLPTDSSLFDNFRVRSEGELLG